jgi:hypothetical protein
MTPEALWSIEFIDNHEHHGGGIAVFYENQVLGGNNGFIYQGKYLLKGDVISFNVRIERFIDDVPGIHKDEFNLTAKGKYNDLEFIVTGSPDDNDELVLAVKCTRRAEINYK